MTGTKWESEAIRNMRQCISISGIKSQYYIKMYIYVVKKRKRKQEYHRELKYRKRYGLKIKTDYYTISSLCMVYVYGFRDF